MLTPEQKAKELFDYFYNTFTLSSVKAKGFDEVFVSKLFAKRVVTELLEAANFGYGYDAEFEVPFYTKVLDEIDKILIGNN